MRYDGRSQARGEHEAAEFHFRWCSCRFAAWPLAARPQQAGKADRLGILRIGPPPPSFIKPLRKVLSDLGRIEGKTMSACSPAHRPMKAMYHAASELA